MNSKTQLLKRMIREEVKRQIKEAGSYNESDLKEFYQQTDALYKYIGSMEEGSKDFNNTQVTQKLKEAKDLVNEAAVIIEQNMLK